MVLNRPNKWTPFGDMVPDLGKVFPVLPAPPGRCSGRRSGDAQDVVGSKEAEPQRTVLA